MSSVGMDSLAFYWNCSLIVHIHLSILLLLPKLAGKVGWRRWWRLGCTWQILPSSLLLRWKEGQVQPGKAEVESAEEEPEWVCDFCRGILTLKDDSFWETAEVDFEACRKLLCVVGWRGQVPFEEEQGWGHVQTGRVEKGFTSSDFTTSTFPSKPPLFLAMFEFISSCPIFADFFFISLDFRGMGFILVKAESGSFSAFKGGTSLACSWLAFSRSSSLAESLILRWESSGCNTSSSQIFTMGSWSSSFARQESSLISVETFSSWTTVSTSSQKAL